MLSGAATAQISIFTHSGQAALIRAAQLRTIQEPTNCTRLPFT